MTNTKTSTPNGPVDLGFDVDALRQQMTLVYGRSVLTSGSAYSIQTANIDGVHFDKQNLQNKQQLLKGLRSDLESAQGHSLTWLNTIEPSLTVLPQGVINFASEFDSEIPSIRKILTDGDTSDNRSTLTQLFNGLQNNLQTQLRSITKVTDSLHALQPQVTQDATNFSESQGKLKALEDLDKENLADAQKNLQVLIDSIDVLDQKISEEELKAGEDFAMAGNVIKLGKMAGDGGKVLGLIIGLPFITRGALEVQQLIADIHRRFEIAVKSVQSQMRVRELTEQLLCLHATSKVMSKMEQNLGDLDKDICTFTGSLENIDGKLTTVLERLRNGVALADIVNAFDLGRASAQWEMATVFAQQVQDFSPQLRLDNVLIAE